MRPSSPPTSPGGDVGSRASGIDVGSRASGIDEVPPGRDEVPLGPPLDDTAERSQRIALGVSAVAAASVVLWLMIPVGLGVVLGLLLALTVHPCFRRVRAGRIGRRWTAAVIVVATALALVGAIGGIATLLIVQGTTVVREAAASWQTVVSISWLSPETVARLARLGLAPANVALRLRDAAGEIASRAVAIAGELLASTASLFLALLFAMLTMYFALVEGTHFRAKVELLLPLRPEYTRALFEELRNVGRSTLLSAIVTGVSQGAFAAIGYWMTGIPQPAFWGAATAVASLVPALGTVLIWLPASVLLIITGHVGRGVLEIAWGVLVVTGVCDYVIRPRVVGKESAMPTFVTFASLFGGVELLGLKGLIVGPILMSLGIAVLRLYAHDVENRRAARAAAAQRGRSQSAPGVRSDP